MADVSLKHVYKIYDGGVTAVTDFNLEIADKEFIILVGPSGCGKSTTLRMIAGLEDISKGELYIGGTLSNDIAPKDRDIAMVFQNYALYPHMTVYDNMAFGLKLRKTPKEEIKRRVEEAAVFSESNSILTESQRLFPADKDSVLLLVVLLYEIQRYSFLTNRFQTLMQSFVLRCVRRFQRFISVSAQRLSM